MGDWGAGKPPQAPRKVIHISVVYLLFLLSLFWCFGSPGLPRPHQASPSLVRSGATVVFAHRERLERPLARAPPCFSHHENAWSARPLGRHNVFHIPRAIGAPVRSGATVFFSPRERMERPSARAPPWFSHPESDWITRPLGRHRVFHTPSALGAQTTPGTRKPDMQNLIFPSTVAI